MRDRLSDRDFEVRAFVNAISGAIQVFFRSKDQLTKSYNAALGRIRLIIQDFPDHKEIHHAWIIVVGEPFGVRDTVEETRSFVDQLCVGFEKVDPWPVVPLFNLYLLSQMPEQKMTSAVDFVSAQRQLDELLSDDICDPTELWREAVKADLEESGPPDVTSWAEYEIHETSKSETNNFYAAVFGI